MRFVFALLFYLSLFIPLSAQAETMPSIDSFVGSDLRYRIGFLWLDHVADGVFTFERDTEADVYRARLVGKTRGFSAWLTNDRVQTYETRMRLLPDGRLQTLTHESMIDKGKGKKRKQRSKYYRFDVMSRQVQIEKRGDGKLMWQKQIAINEEQFPVDVLTAFFNFVTGVYGPFELGKRYEVPAFSGEGVGMIHIEVVPASDAPGSLFSDDVLLCRVKVDQDVFDTSNGILYIQFDTAMRPTRGLIKDIVGMGDIRGILR